MTVEIAAPVAIGLIGAGRIGTSHAGVIAERVPGARLAAVADPRPEAAQALADRYGARAFTDPIELINDPEITAVVIAAYVRGARRSDRRGGRCRKSDLLRKTNVTQPGRR